jgi:hypothetical protein
VEESPRTKEAGEQSGMNDFVKRLQAIPVGTVIPKPEANADFLVKGWGKRKGETALVYFIPNHSGPNRPHQKGITLTEWKLAFTRLQTTGEFTRKWFEQALPRCAREGDCNFTTIGGILTLLNYARYAERGIYRALFC